MLVTELVNEINQIVEPWWKFNMEDIYGDRGSSKYPAIENLTLLYWKLDGHKKSQLSKNKQNNVLNQVNNLLVKKILNLVKLFKYNRLENLFVLN